MARAVGLAARRRGRGQRPAGRLDRRHRRADRPRARRRAPSRSSSASAGRRPPTAGSGAVGRSTAAAPPAGVELLVACDVRTRFVDAAAVFGPQKGATPAQVELLAGRLERLAQIYLRGLRRRRPRLEGGGAAGGLAGALAALGGTLVPGLRSRRRRARARRPRRRRRRRRHRRGLPRRPELRGQGRRRRVRAARRPASGRGRSSATPTPRWQPSSTAATASRSCRSWRATASSVPLDEPRWCIEHAGRTLIARLG